MANKATYDIHSLTVKDGLSQISVLQILQDKQGYMWFATREGLNKYDGSEFTVYQHSSEDSLSLSNNYILSLAEDKQGNIWIGTLSGLNCYNTQKEIINRIQLDGNNVIRDIYIDHNQKIWLATENGICLYENGKCKRYKISSEVHNIVSAICEYDELLLIGTKLGLYIFDPITFTSKNYNVGIPNLNVRDIYKTSQNRLFVGSALYGLFELDGISGVKRQFLHKISDNNTLLDNSVRCLSEDMDGNLLIGTANGINIFDPIENKFMALKQTSEKENGLTHFSVHSVYTDRIGTIWIGMWGGGVNYFNPHRTNNFHQYIPQIHGKTLPGMVGPMVSDQKGCWIGLEGGGFVFFDQEKETYQHYTIPNSHEDNIRSNIVNSLFLNNDILHIGANNGTYARFNVETRQFLSYQKLVEGGSIQAIQGDEKGNIFLGISDNNGLILIEKNGKITDQFYDQSGKELHFRNICSIVKDAPDTYLLGSDLGYYRYNFSTHQCFHVPNLSVQSSINTRVTCMLKDRRNYLWIATMQDGILCFDRKNNLRKQYTVSNSELPTNNVYTLIEDEQGNIWATTLSSVVKIDVDKQETQAYKSIYVNEFTLRSATVYKHTIYFGGDKGFVGFQPQSIQQNTTVSPIIITHLWIDNNEVYPAVNDFRHNTTVISYKQSSITIEYQTLEFLDVENCKYAYQLEGFDKQWNYVGKRNSAHYTNLPEGEYTFKVMTANSDGVWSNDAVQINFIILPPPWKTWWAYTLYIASFFFVVFMYVRYLRKQIQIKNKILLKQIEQKNSDKLHTDRINLFTNFSHELRTPLSLIISPLEELLLRDDLSYAVKTSLTLMYKNSRRLLNLVNELMDFRKKESGNLHLKATESDFSNFVGELVLAFSDLAKSKNIELIFNKPEDKIMLWFDGNLMEKVLLNLLSNAFKHTPNGGRIKLTITGNSSNGSEYLYLIVEDNGVSIPPNELKAIFDPFYQVNNGDNKLTNGTGMGLNIVKGIIELHSGTIWAENIPHGGVRFVSKLPFGNTHLKQEQIYTETALSELKGNYITTDEEEKNQKIDFEPHLKNKYTILLVEDNQDVLDYISGFLSEFYKIYKANNGEDAAKIVFEKMPDVVLTDVMMPKMDGIQLCRILKNDIRSNHIPIILLTARTSALQIEDGLSIGADDYITKPFNIRHLMLKIKNVLMNRERLKELYSKNFNTQELPTVLTSNDERFMQKLYAVMEANVSNSEFNMDTFCKEIGMSKTNLYNKIKSLTNFTPSEFIRNSRLAIAAKILREKKVPVIEVSVLVGYNSHSYFTSCFRSVYKMSPTEYANQFRK